MIHSGIDDGLVMMLFY